MKYSILLFFIVFVSITNVLVANENSPLALDTVIIASNSVFSEETIKNDSTITSLKDKRKKKIISAIAAFPFPLGFVGAHRVVLGTKPWVPVVYVATFGGVFGLLPLIDFCVILFSKNSEQYENNPNIFMWVK